MLDPITNDSDDEEETCQIFLWGRVGSFSGAKELFFVDGSSIIEGKNIRNALQ
jgi:hypothetical protein